MFKNAKRIEAIILNPFIEEIKPGSFDGCSKLECIYIPKSIKYIPHNLFKDSKQLKRVYYEGYLDEYKKIKIEEGNSLFIRPKGRIYHKILDDLEKILKMKAILY